MDWSHNGIESDQSHMKPERCHHLPITGVTGVAPSTSSGVDFSNDRHISVEPHLHARMIHGSKPLFRCASSWLSRTAANAASRDKSKHMRSNTRCWPEVGKQSVNTVSAPTTSTLSNDSVKS